MPAYTPKFTTTAFKGGKNILASEHLQFIEGGATLDGTKFAAGLIEVGTLIARNTTSGKYEKFTTVTGFDSLGILNIDAISDGVHDLVVGEVIVRGSVYEAKLPTNAALAAFKTAAPLIRYVKHI
ncbi:hypothetical protein J2T13_000153 [Paenibacillus sp. DS2015]|uniref:hypothetical protein n=1 Tax=Paenibacillus sp. DS2015 TaxID=3373917 RepID=UPI003D1BADFE